MAQINLPAPSSQFERDLVLQLTSYFRDIYGKLDAQRGYKWNDVHPVLGGYNLWVDSSGRLRIKSSQPTSELDGVVVGTQL